ncbi:protein synthesis inhibitor II-like [Phragmites australis]|uniref:protein synthesis inhibitor II-like n=1 Tax=Phragmites australis TaxID=29695 RepID=UPI002D78AA0E|nr:protein synthesis inhibitor II-like [Phragmites australis]
MALNPLFTVTFDVNSSDNYGDFIAGLRHRLGNPRHFSRNRPVLPPVEGGANHPPLRWFHVVLRTQAGALTLATRADNLYLEGFQSRDGTWWELTRGLIPGATYLSFGGTYPDLLGDTDRLVGVALGPAQMTEAVNVLAARTRADLASRAAQRRARDALPVLLLMVHEATRFVTVSGLVAGLMHPKAAMKRGTITAQMKAQVNGWKDLSAALLKADARPPVPFTPFEGMGVGTVEQAAATVGILLFVEVPGCMTAATALRLFREG